MGSGDGDRAGALAIDQSTADRSIVLSDDTQVALAVRSAVVSSEKIPVAVNWMEVPLATLGFTGVISIALSVAAVTVAIVVPTTPFTDALIVELPWLTPVIRPWLPGVLLTDATAGADDDQVAELVRFTVDPSEKMPVAVSWMLDPLSMLGADGVTCTAVRVAAVTVTVVEPCAPSKLAVIVAEPCASPNTNPAWTVAMLPADDVQVAVPVRSSVLPSEKVPVAASWKDVPSAIAGFTGVTAIDDSVAAVTVTALAPETPWRIAFIVAAPAITPVTRP